MLRLLFLFLSCRCFYCFVEPSCFAFFATVADLVGGGGFCFFLFVEVFAPSPLQIFLFCKACAAAASSAHASFFLP
jgi:hypothetical protein